jgi:hypothetical protein
MVGTRHPLALLALLLSLETVPGLARGDDPQQDPCVSDLQRLCPDVKPGGGRGVACLRQNGPKLSDACRVKLEADETRVRAMIAQFSRACRADVGQFCADVEKGSGRVFDCLDAHSIELSSSCQSEITKITLARTQIQAVTAACRADIGRLCQGVPRQTSAILQCLQAHESELSPDCTTSGARRAVNAAVLVDTLEEMTSEDRIQESLQILQGLDSVAFTRSQVLLQFDSYQSLGGKANGSRLLFNPQFVFGDRNQFAVQVKVPVTALYPYAPSAPTQFGLGAVVTAFAWNFANTGQFRHFAALGLQWETASTASIGGPWAIVPAYAVGAALARFVSLTVQLQWIKSFGSSKYPEANLLILEPILAANLPGRSYLALDTRLAWDFVHDSFVPLMKGVAGIFTDRQKSLSISAWYQGALSQTAADLLYKYEVGMGLAYFFDW